MRLRAGRDRKCRSESACRARRDWQAIQGIFPRHNHRIDGSIGVDGRLLHAVEFRVDKAHVKAGVMNNQWGIGYKGYERIGDFRENRLVAEKLVGKPVDLEGFGGHGPFRIDILMVRLSL